MNHGIKLGSPYVDQVTGYTGIAVQITDHINGCVQIALQPRCTDPAKMPDPLYLDYQRLAPTNEDGFIAPEGSEVRNKHFELGQEVVDTLSGFEGTTVVRVHYLSGRIDYVVQPKVAKDKPTEYPDNLSFASYTLKAKEVPPLKLPKSDTGSTAIGRSAY